MSIFYIRAIVRLPALIEDMKEIAMTSQVDRSKPRLVARTSAEVQEIIQRAADYSGTTLSQFIVESSVERARAIIERTHSLKLTMAGSEALFDALENPPKANNQLLEAAKRYKEHVNVNRRRNRKTPKAP